MIPPPLSPHALPLCPLCLCGSPSAVAESMPTETQEKIVDELNRELVA